MTDLSDLDAVVRAADPTISGVAVVAPGFVTPPGWTVVATRPDGVIIVITTPDGSPASAAAQQAALTVDLTPATVAARAAARFPDIATLQANAVQAIADINTYLAIANPTNAQVVAAVNKLAIDMRTVIRCVGYLVQAQLQ